MEIATFFTTAMTEASNEQIKKVKESGEFHFSKIKHPNLIEYDSITIDIVHDKFCIIIGEYNLIIMKENRVPFKI